MSDVANRLPGSGAGGEADGKVAADDDTGSSRNAAAEAPRTLFYLGTQGTGPAQFNFPSAVALTWKK